MNASAPTGAPCIVGLPYDASSSFLRGAAKSPSLIREALHSPAGNLWTEGGIDLGESGVLTDAGDTRLPPTAEARTLIERAIGGILDEGRRPLALGGDHSVTYPVVRAIAARVSDLTILHVDAHPDLYDEFEGDRHSHACPFARIMEDGLAKRLVQVGIRTMNGHQRAQAARYGVEVIAMADWARGARPVVTGAVYLSVDLDGVDPAFAPGVSHREPGGLTAREVLGIVHGIEGRIVGADIVEYNPLQDTGDLTARLAAKLLKEIAGRMIETGSR